MPTEEEIKSVCSLEKIEELISICNRCPLSGTKTNDVPGKGSLGAEILFIGEAPGKTEDLLGEPFVGAAGKFLEEMLKSVDLSRSEVFIANVLKHRPPQNRDPQPKEIAACWPYLVRQIEIIDPRLIVFLGRHALNRFFPEEVISKVHGQSFQRHFQGEKRDFLALYHPAAGLYNGGMRETLKEDFKKIPVILDKIKNQNRRGKGEENKYSKSDRT